MLSFHFRFLPAALLLAAISSAPAVAQSSSSQTASAGSASLSPVREMMSRHPWNWGAFFDGGFSAGVTPTSSYLSAGARAAKC